MSSSLEDRVLAYFHSAGLRAGDVVPSELELASELKVGRPALREALGAGEVICDAFDAGRKLFNIAGDGGDVLTARQEFVEDAAAAASGGADQYDLHGKISERELVQQSLDLGMVEIVTINPPNPHEGRQPGALRRWVRLQVR